MTQSILPLDGVISASAAFGSTATVANLQAVDGSYAQTGATSNAAIYSIHASLPTPPGTPLTGTSVQAVQVQFNWPSGATAFQWRLQFGYNGTPVGNSGWRNITGTGVSSLQFDWATMLSAGAAPDGSDFEIWVDIRNSGGFPLGVGFLAWKVAYSTFTGLAVDIESAFNLPLVINLPAGIAAAGNTAFALVPLQLAPVGLATEADECEGQPALTISQTYITFADVAPVGLATSGSTAFALVSTQSAPVGMALAANQAFSLLAAATPLMTISWAAIFAPDAPIAPDFEIALRLIPATGVGLSLEVDAQIQMSGGQTPGIPASVASEAFALVPLQLEVLGLATEVELAIRPVFLAIETERALQLGFTIMSKETDLAQKLYPPFTALDTETARALTLVAITRVRLAFENELAIGPIRAGKEGTCDVNLNWLEGRKPVVYNESRFAG